MVLPNQQIGDAMVVDSQDDALVDDFEDMVDDFDSVMEEEETPFVITNTGSQADEVFDRTVGILEKVALEFEGEFPAVVSTFVREHCRVFEDTDDNPHCYMDIFQEYTRKIEAYLEQACRREMPEFSMANFIQQVEGREDEICPDTLELLVSLADFRVFKEMMLGEKENVGQNENICVESPTSKHRRPDLCIFGRESRIFAEEQEDGEPFPDLNLDILAHDSPSSRPKKRICG